jgi:hypothetical protein
MAIAVTLMIGSSGCFGLIAHGTQQDITINSIPSDATVFVDGIERGKTPIVLPLERRSSHTVRIEMAGYESSILTIHKSVEGPTVVLDVLFTALIGLAVDAAAGSLYILSPEQVEPELTEISFDWQEEARVTVLLKPRSYGAIQNGLFQDTTGLEYSLSQPSNSPLR